MQSRRPTFDTRHFGIRQFSLRPREEAGHYQQQYRPDVRLKMHYREIVVGVIALMTWTVASLLHDRN